MPKDTGKVLIHGKEYETVASRVQKFRKEYKDYSLRTEIVDRDDTTVVMRAAVVDEMGVVRATGYAEESRSASTINKTSALENCETSAIGRALAMFGLGGTEFASADEVAQAITRQSKSDKAVGDHKYAHKASSSSPATPGQKKFVMDLLEQQGVAKEDANGYLVEQLGLTVPLTFEGAQFAIEELKSLDPVIA